MSTDKVERADRRGGVGANVSHPDARLKACGEFAYSSDLWVEGMLWGVTVRSPHVAARIRSIDTSAAKSVRGVRAVLTHEDVPGAKTYGLKRPDQPVLAFDEVRYRGEAVALIAADDVSAARAAADLVVVDYDPLDPVVDPELACESATRELHPGGNLVRHIHVLRGEGAAATGLADVVVQGVYEVGMQDQAFLGPESGLAIPAGDGGVDMHVATQWLHEDRRQMASCLGLPEALVRVWLGGVGGAFGGREDLSVQIHASLLALRTGRPVKMVYARDESFVGHVHRHPARLVYEHGATSAGDLVYVKADIRFDGGAYHSGSDAVCLVAATTSAGPYCVPHADVAVSAVYTNNPPCGAMRGFGAVQTCFAYEAQMDKLAVALGIDPLELRKRNGLRTGAEMVLGQAVTGPAPIGEMLDRLQRVPPPPVTDSGAELDRRLLPGGVANVTHGEGVRRGVGYALGFKNICRSAGWSETSIAKVRLYVVEGEPVVEVHSAAAENGQGVITMQEQIARTELGVDDVVVRPAHTSLGNTGASAASRQTWITGGAVKAAAEAVREALLDRATGVLPGESGDGFVLADGAVTSADGRFTLTIAELVGHSIIEAEREYRAPGTVPLDENGQGNAHVTFGFAAHRAVVDVDVELGLVRVVEIATVQDVGKAINPRAVEGQIEGGTAQGLGLALMEEILVERGVIRNASFTDYLIPTILDMPPMKVDLLENPQPEAPYGLNGVGEPPAISSTPAIVAALRDATGLPLTRVPVRPELLAADLLPTDSP